MQANYSLQLCSATGEFLRSMREVHRRGPELATTRGFCELPVNTKPACPEHVTFKHRPLPWALSLKRKMRSLGSSQVPRRPKTGRMADCAASSMQNPSAM